ncbi:cytochrome d ubiquinol oxidase subunit II [Paenibacillus wenxiniae]|uniref:Cytochrome d ubiquinol oxidase subunit II n=1 Tax=Paenibacillus wenxiniae TaxID=1636843 RepID=A0ABW4RMY4_9BACL
MLSLNELWFVLIAVLFVGFFFLEGFDFGVGMSTRLLARTDGEKRLLINSIGPFWDGNEVWLLTAGGAMFAAFPNWYATLFSGFYIPFVVLLLALIARGVAFEFRGKVGHRTWTAVWDWCIFLGSLLPPLLFGVAFSTMLKGLPIDRDMQMYAGLFDVINPYSLVAGLTTVMLCLLHGLMFSALRTTGQLRERAHALAHKLMIPLAVLFVLTAILTAVYTDAFRVRGAVLIAMAALGIVLFILAGYFIAKRREGWAFGMTGGLIALAISGIFVALFPRVMVSSLGAAYDLTVYNAASGPYSLKVMTIVAITLLPFVLGYQIWSYFVFHKRLNEKTHLEY